MQLGFLTLALCGLYGRVPVTYGLPFVLSVPIILMAFAAAVGNLVQADSVTTFVQNNWHLIMQLISPSYQYLPASTYAQDCLGAIRVRRH